MKIDPKNILTNPAQRQLLSRLGKRVTYALTNNGSKPSTRRTIKPEPGSSVLARNNLFKNLKVVEQNSLEIQNSNEKGRGLYSNVQIKKETLIGVYGGTLLTEEEATTLESNYNWDAKTNVRIQYLFDLGTVVQDGYSPLINKDIEKLNNNERFNKAGKGQYPDVFQTPSKLSFVNHGTKKEQNAKFQSIKIKPIEYRGMRVTEILVMKAIKAIKIGAEIITDYGPEYSKLLREKNIDNQRVLNSKGLFIDRVVEGNIISIKPENKLVGARDLEKDGATAECSEADARNLEEDSATAEYSAAKILIGMSQGYKNNQEKIGREAPAQNRLTKTTKKRKREREKGDSLKRKNYYVWVKDGKEVQQGIKGAEQITKRTWRQRQDTVWVKNGKEVQQGIKGAEQITKRTRKRRQNKVWIKDNQLVNQGTEGAEQITKQ